MRVNPAGRTERVDRQRMPFALLGLGLDVVLACWRAFRFG
jgi:hypothetical protein